MVLEDAVPHRRPAPVRLPDGHRLGAPGGSGGLQRLQHHDVRDQVRGRQHGVHARPLRPLLLHQRQPGQLHGQPEAHRRRHLRRPHSTGSLADSSSIHAADLPRAGAEPVVATVSSIHAADLRRAGAEPVVATVSSFHGAAVWCADAEPDVTSFHGAADWHADAQPDVASLWCPYAHPRICTISHRFSSRHCSRWHSRIIAVFFTGYPGLWRGCCLEGRPNQHACSRLWLRHASDLSVNCEAFTYIL